MVSLVEVLNMTIDNMRIIGRRIARYREEAKLNQEELSELMGMSVNGISNLERGKNNLKFSTMTRLCEVLNITPCQLLVGAIHDRIDDNIIDLIIHLDNDEKEILYQLLLTFKEQKENLKK